MTIKPRDAPMAPPPPTYARKMQSDGSAEKPQVAIAVPMSIPNPMRTTANSIVSSSGESEDGDLGIPSGNDPSEARAAGARSAGSAG